MGSAEDVRHSLRQLVTHQFKAVLSEGVHHDDLLGSSEPTVVVLDPSDEDVHLLLLCLGSPTHEKPEKDELEFSDIRIKGQGVLTLVVDLLQFGQGLE